MEENPDLASAKETRAKELEESIKNIGKFQENQIAKVIKDYQNQFETAKTELGATATAEAKRKFDQEVSRMRKELEEYKKDIERFAGKDKTVRAKYTSGINDTLKSMEEE